MQISGVALGDLYAITSRVSERVYGRNVIVSPDAHAVGPNRITGRLRVLDSRGAGARTAASGRHGPYACWHVYRDVLRELFGGYPRATVSTALASYRGADGFERNYPATRHRNMGSLLSPAYMPDLCVTADCGNRLAAALTSSTVESDLDGDLARIARELQEADQTPPEPLVFEGPSSLKGVPDLAYSGR
jgi:hypothetical protein